MAETPIPVVDLAATPAAVAQGLARACRDSGFFHVAGHGVDGALVARLERLSREFFAQDLERKLAIRMERGGRAWRGYFPVGAELTSGRPDIKEGLYFGAELGPDHPRVAAGVPLHGPNLFPELPGFRAAVLEYTAALTELGRRLMEGLAASLDLAPAYFAERCTREPLILLRIFHYPPLAGAPQGAWSVAEHTDYGLLTILRQDSAGGLQVKSRARWIDVPPLPGTFVCNIGDMLERMTGGRYRSTPHRVRNPGTRSRLSFAFFFDPDFDAEVRPIDPRAEAPGDAAERWDASSVHAFEGTYGEYLMAKVGKVFPALFREQLTRHPHGERPTGDSGARET